jgi:hypothetical protein
MMKKETEDEKFPIREYTKLELAILYNPNMKIESAQKKLTRWVKGCGSLMKELEAVDWHPLRRSYLPKEVELIVKYLGTPG